MKLATYIHNGIESWGYVLPNPHDEGKDWIFNPAKTEAMIKRSAKIKTASLKYALPAFLGKIQWPDTLMECLRLGPDAMDLLKKLHEYTSGFLTFGDRVAIQYAGVSIDAVKLRAPLPHTRLLLGLVQNCPSFWHTDMNVKHVSLVPRMHQRPMTSLVGPGETLGGSGGNVEFGIVIGKEGKNIPIEKAYEHIAGYTVIIDQESKHPWLDFEGKHYTDVSEVAPHKDTWDWYDLCATSYLGKKADCFCAMGPYIVTPEEVGNHYDLITETGHDGIMRDRAHTCSLSIGIERFISWLSSFITLYPGDVLHMGTTGTDGLFVDADMYHEGMTMESYIEKVGLLQVKISKFKRTADEQPAMHPPAVEDFIQAGKCSISSADDWNLNKISNFWMCILNNKNCQETDDIYPVVSPRIFNGPNTCAGWTGTPLTINARATSLKISVQLGIVMKTMTKQVKGCDIKDCILGYTPVISVADRSLWDEFFTHAEPPINGRCVNTYCHWGDGTNKLKTPILLDSTENLKMKLSVEGYGDVTVSTADYNCGPERTVEYLSGCITLFPGDVVCLGRPSKVIEIPAGADIDGCKVTAEIEGLGQVTAILQREK